MTRSFLADEHVKRVYVAELRANGYSVDWVDGAYEPGTTDREHLQRSQDESRVILSNDSDFVRLHDQYDHAGLVLYDDQNASVTDFVAGIARLERFVPDEELRGNVVWLDEWID